MRKDDAGEATRAGRFAQLFRSRPDEAYFWATHGGAELDLLLVTRGKRIGVECKRQDAPALTSSMRVALADLKLDELIVADRGSRSYALGERVRVVPLTELVAHAGGSRQRRKNA